MSHLNPTQTRILQSLLIRPYTIRELIFDVGCNWPPDSVQHLRKDFQLEIDMKIKKGFNRYNEPITFGVYTLISIDEAIKLLDEAVTPPNNTDIT